MINKLETGKRIAHLRGKLGYSQAVFAEKLNVSPQAVSKRETGQTLPDVEILLTLSWMCRVTINEILDADEIFVDRHNCMEREFVRMNKYLICPECKKDLSLKVQANGSQYFECESHHRFNIEDGVVYFNTREIPCNEIMWQEIEKQRPATIVDIACGMGHGIQYILERINWPCTVIMTDLSFRILAWNRKYFMEEIKNPM